METKCNRGQFWIWSPSMSFLCSLGLYARGADMCLIFFIRREKGTGTLPPKGHANNLDKLPGKSYLDVWWQGAWNTAEHWFCCQKDRNGSEKNWFGSLFRYLTQEETFYHALSPFPSTASLRLEFSHTCMFHFSLQALSFILHNPPPFEGGDWELSVWSPSQPLQSWLLSICTGRQADGQPHYPGVLYLISHLSEW